MLKKIVLTGAAGRLASYLREPLTQLAHHIVSTDIVDDIGKLYDKEQYVKADLSKLDDIMPIMQDADMVVHFGAIGDEAPFNDILHANIIGAYNIWEAAHRHKVRRVIYASSIHAVGMYNRHQVIDSEVKHRPDSYYGLAKCFAEDLASLYWEKCQIEAICLRIASCASVSSERSLNLWLSYDDLIHLVEQSVRAPIVGFSVMYGISNNDRACLDNSKSRIIGYKPQDNAEDYADTILANSPLPSLDDQAMLCHGGPFATTILGESGVAALNIKDKPKH